MSREVVKLLVKLDETAKICATLASKVSELESRVAKLETRKVGRPPKGKQDAEIQ